MKMEMKMEMKMKPAVFQCLRISILFFVATFSFNQLAYAINVEIPILKVESATVEFLAIGRPSFLKVKGHGRALSGQVKRLGPLASGEFTFDLRDLDTGIELRNDHMKNKYLEVDKFPQATLRFKDVPAEEGQQHLITAELELHGIQKPIEVDVSIKSVGEAKVASANFKLKLTDYKITIPSHLGITIADEVSVKIDAALKE